MTVHLGSCRCHHLAQGSSVHHLHLDLYSRGHDCIVVCAPQAPVGPSKPPTPTFLSLRCAPQTHPILGLKPVGHALLIAQVQMNDSVRKSAVSVCLSDLESTYQCSWLQHLNTRYLNPKFAHQLADSLTSKRISCPRAQGSGGTRSMNTRGQTSPQVYHL